MTTELTLRAFGELAARGELPVHVALRGDPEVLRSRAWPGASTETDSTDPHAFLGQSGWRGPDRRVELAFHQLRPLTGGPRLQWLHDTIPIHFARNAMDRRLRVAYLRRIVRTSSELLVDSRHTARCVVDELGADPDRLESGPVEPSKHEDSKRISAELSLEPIESPRTTAVRKAPEIAQASR